MIISSSDIGENLEFRCFCPKIFSSTNPIHLEDSLIELQRRMLIIRCQRIEALSDERLSQLGVTRKNWYLNLIDINAYNWDGFNSLFDNFWDLDMAQSFTLVRKTLSRSLAQLSSQQ